MLSEAHADPGVMVVHGVMFLKALGVKLCKIPEAGLQHLCRSTWCFMTMTFYAPPGEKPLKNLKHRECEGQPGGSMRLRS